MWWIYTAEKMKPLSTNWLAEKKDRLVNSDICEEDRRIALHDVMCVCFGTNSEYIEKDGYSIAQVSCIFLLLCREMRLL